MRVLDRVFGGLLVLGGIGHSLGSYKAYNGDRMVLLWAWSASLAVFLLAAVNLLRAGRNADRSLAWISFVACLAWVAFAVWFGRLIGNLFDPRPLGNAVITLVLAIFSLRSALHSSA
jgi:hypothetical protein